jgi:hypothetical protein
MADLATLDIDLRPWAEDMFRLAKSLDRRFVVTSARRSWFEQARLYSNYLWQRGLEVGVGADLGPANEGPSKLLPVAPPGRSAHESGMAWDMARIGIKPFEDDLLPILGAVWNRVGGLWRTFDPVHFEG